MCFGLLSSPSIFSPLLLPIASTPPVCPHRSAKGSLAEWTMGERTISEPLPGAARFQRAPACHHKGSHHIHKNSTLLYFSLLFSTLFAFLDRSLLNLNLL